MTKVPGERPAHQPHKHSMAMFKKLGTSCPQCAMFARITAARGRHKGRKGKGSTAP